MQRSGGYWDRIDRIELRAVRHRRGKDGSRLRLLGQWLRAGVLEEGARTHAATGVVQGGSLHPSWPMSFSIMSWRSGASRQYGRG